MITLELDATFDGLEPYVTCIPAIIYRNTSIHLGLLISISESTSLYSFFFQSLKKMDVEKPNPNFSYYEKYAEKNYIIDEHKSFIKRQKKKKKNI